VPAAAGGIEYATEDGWKLQTAQEKNWTTERQTHLKPKPKERNDIIRSSLQQIFDEPDFKTYRHQNFRFFRIGISLDDFQIGDEGDINLTLSDADQCPAHRRRDRPGTDPLDARCHYAA
jgi:hypothetical protein